jgi:hypothetical protein
VELAIETAEAVTGEEAAPRLADECRSDEAGRLVRRGRRRRISSTSSGMSLTFFCRGAGGMACGASMFLRVGGCVELMGSGGCFIRFYGEKV